MLSSPRSRTVRRTLALAAPAALAAVLATAGCSPVKAGAAATVGDQRITTAQLDAGVNSLIQDVRLAGQEATPSADLTRYELADQVTSKVSEAAAARLNVAVTTTEVDALQSQVQAQPTNALEAVLVEAAQHGHGGDLREYARVAALRQRIAATLAPNVPASDTAGTAAKAKALTDYLTTVANELKVTVNPRYGAWSAKDMLVTAKSDPFVKPAPAPSQQTLS